MKSIYKKFTRRSLLTILIAHFAMLSFAATYYISPTGNDATGDGSISKPYFTLNKVWTVLGAGDTVYLRGGTYAFNTQQSLTGKNGTSSNPIKIFAYPNETPVLTKSASYTAIVGIYFEGNYFHWKGIEITGFVQLNADLAVIYGMRAVASSYNTFENFKVHGNGCGFSMANNLSTTIHCTGNLFLNSDFYENQDPLTSANNYGNADGLSIAYIGITSDTNTIRGCRFWWNSDDGIDLFYNDGVVVIEDCQVFYNGYIPNTFNTGGDGIGLKLGDSSADYSSSVKRIVKNCLAVKNRRHGFGQNGLYGIVEMYNCTGYLNTGLSFSMGVHLADFNIAHTVKNCIAYANTMNPNLGTTTTSVTNSWQNGNVVNDADFVSVNHSLLLTVRQADGSLPVTDFLKLVAGSDLIDAGTVVSGIPYIGSAPDLGAYESGNTDNTAPSVTAFTIPATSTSLTVSLSSLTATDNVGVVGYLLTETSSTPSSVAPGWSSTKPTTYLFTTIGTKTLYAWVKDAVGNVSTSRQATIVISAPAATSFSFTGPSTGNVNSASANFTVTPDNLFTGTVTITPTGSGSVGLSTKVLTFSNSSAAQTFTITPTVAGSITLSATNNGTLTNPANLTYTSNPIVSGAPTSVVATAGNTIASVTFAAPISNGGSVITGYTVTSIPAGGIDSNAGSTSLTHTITGLTNGTTYTFTVKATNSAGTSVASVASNSVIPKAPAATGFLFTGPLSGSVNSPSANFTVTPNNLFTGTVTITPTGSGSVGLSTRVITFSNSSAAQTFTITPTVAGSITLTAINNGTLTNPANLTYTSNAIVPDAPSSVVATSGDASATVTFIAPTNTGGSAITGYTVTSIPGGGIDENAGSTALTHTITGLTNGTSYTFTVKASNSFGSSVSSVTSNSVIPEAVSVIIKQGSIPPTHFIPVWNGENGLNHMNIMVVSADLEDLPLSVNDEIAVFSGAKCVGSMRLSRTISAADNSTFLTIPASQDDGSGNGFILNDTILFKIWDDKNQQEMIAKAVVYQNNISTWLTSGKYAAGATSVVEIVSYTEYSQTIALKKGYNMISTFVTAQNPLASDVTQSLADAGYLIKLQDEAGNSLEDWGTFGGWVNNVGSIKDTEGYKIKVSENCSLQVTGRPIALPLDIPLRSGWNIISFPRTDLVDAMNIMQPLIDQNKLIKVQDESGNSIENWGIFGGWKNGIGYFIPGKAYKVKMTSDAVLAIQENYLKSGLILADTEDTEYFSTEVEGNGSEHMNINIVGLRDTGISIGDELAAFDGKVCVGTIKITENHIMDGSASLVASFSSDELASDGFTEGHAIQIAAWNKLTGEESTVKSDVLSGQMSYAKNSSVLLKVNALTTDVKNFLDVVTIDVFPNPSQGKVTVRFSTIPDAGSSIAIFDISGRKVASRNITGTSEVFNLDQQPAGVYLVKSKLGSTEKIHKLVIN